jgi:hypothetical protein
MKILLLLLVSVLSVGAAEFDAYGGSTRKTCTGGAQLHWYTEKIDGRWWFCTPDGNVFWMHSLWNLSPSSTGRTHAKYGGSSSNKAATFSRRVKTWGFNAVDAYSTRNMASTLNTHIQTEDALGVIMGEGIRPSYYGLKNSPVILSYPLKALDVIDWLNGQRGGAWRFQDVFDTRYALYFGGMLDSTSDNLANHVFTSTDAKRKNIIGWSIDDTDWLFGFGAGPGEVGREFITPVDGVAATDNKRHQQIGLLALYTPPALGVNERDPADDISPSGMIYGDPRTVTITCKGPEEPAASLTTSIVPADTNCTKKALQSFLQQRYITIDALNSAWGLSPGYSTWNSSGTTVSNQLVATTDGSGFITFTVPSISASDQISPFSVRAYLDGDYLGADSRTIDIHSVYGCDATASTGFIFGEPLSGQVSTGCGLLSGASIVVSGSNATITRSGGLSVTVGTYITISGVTVDTDLNSTCQVTAVTSTTVVTCAGITNTTDGTYNESALRIQIRASEVNYQTGVVTLRFDTQFGVSGIVVDGSNNAVISFDNPYGGPAVSSVSIGESLPITGATGTATTLNGSWVVTAKNTTTNTVTVTTSGVSAGTYSSCTSSCGSVGVHNVNVATIVTGGPIAGLEVRFDYTIDGWSRGTGLMDESGSSAWLVDITTAGTDSFLLLTVDADIKTDLDDFLYRYAYRYFKDIRDTLDARTTGCDRNIPGTCYLFTGPSYLGTWGSPTYKQILQAASTFVDVFPAYGVPYFLENSQDRIDYVYDYFGDKPIISWEGFTGGLDSPFPVDGGNQVHPRDQTQLARGTRYKEVVTINQALQYPNGVYPVIGIRWWDLAGSTGENELGNSYPQR